MRNQVFTAAGLAVLLLSMPPAQAQGISSNGDFLSGQAPATALSTVTSQDLQQGGGNGGSTPQQGTSGGTPPTASGNPIQLPQEPGAAADTPESQAANAAKMAGMEACQLAMQAAQTAVETMMQGKDQQQAQALAPQAQKMITDAMNLCPK
jgi:hypothetical protein